MIKQTKPEQVILESNNITAFDIDETLLFWKHRNEPGKDKVQFLYGDEKIFLKPHRKHIAFLKHCYNRGDFIIVWSKNGWQWAEQVVEKLELQDYVHVIMSKVTRAVDDKRDLSSIVGDVLYIEDED